MDRAQHLAWAKARALALVAAGNLPLAWASLIRDMDTHADLRDHKAVEQITRLLLAGAIQTPAFMRQLIEAIN